MESIGNERIRSFLSTTPDKAMNVSNTQIRGDSGVFVKDYLDLATKIAELQYINNNYILLFRGQSNDYKNQSQNTSLKPSIFRPDKNGKLPSSEKINERFCDLARYESLLVERYKASKIENGLIGLKKLEMYKVIRWSILQHYEVCLTPLLDVTHSLRIASSFASNGNEKKAYLYVIGVPNLAGSITASAECGLQIIRLASICPPSALRPHIQEGYLLGEYPEISTADQKQLYAHHEIDFGRRLLAKFIFNPNTFWKNTLFPKIKESALYPNDGDVLFKIASEIKKSNTQQ